MGSVEIILKNPQYKKDVIQVINEFFCYNQNISVLSNKIKIYDIGGDIEDIQALYEYLTDKNLILNMKLDGEFDLM